MNSSKIKKILSCLSLWISRIKITKSWLLTEGSLKQFPPITPKDKILIISPHIDDEIICCAGLIQNSLTNKAKIKIVYLTNGDNNLVSIILTKPKKYDPNDFIKLGKKRMEEAIKSTNLLNIKPKDLIFLGYPDGGIKTMYSKNYLFPYSSCGTRLTYNPYPKTYQLQQKYTGKNLFSNLKQIINNYQPTIIIFPDHQDKDTDHQGANLFTKKVINQLKNKVKTYTFLVHYPCYPPYQKRIEMDRFLYPPKHLFTKNDWYSYNLSPKEKISKLKAVKQNQTQVNTNNPNDLLKSFIKNNELFKKVKF